jgi:hypothetical protein
MILIAMPSCPGLGLVILARSMRRTSAALFVCWARLRGHGVLLTRTRLYSAHIARATPDAPPLPPPAVIGGVLSEAAVAASPARPESGSIGTHLATSNGDFGNCHWQVPIQAIECDNGSLGCLEVLSTLTGRGVTKVAGFAKPYDPPA